MTAFEERLIEVIKVATAVRVGLEQERSRFWREWLGLRSGIVGDRLYAAASALQNVGMLASVGLSDGNIALYVTLPKRTAVLRFIPLEYCREIRITWRKSKCIPPEAFSELMVEDVVASFVESIVRGEAWEEE